MPATVAQPLLGGVLELIAEMGMKIDPAWQSLAREARVTREEYHRLWREIEQAAGSEGIALRLAEKIDSARFGVLDYSMRNAPNFRASIYEFCRNLGVLYTGVRVELRVGEDESATLFFNEPTAPRCASEWAVAAWARLFKQICGPEFSPVAVRFQHPAPDDDRAHRRFFGCQVMFGQSETGMDFSAELLDKPVQGADPHLYRVLSSYIEVEKASIDDDADGFLSRVRSAIERSFQDGNPKRDHVARTLGMSGSTLGRRLKEEGVTSFSQYVEEIRKEIAMVLLNDSKMQISDIAYSLGYSDPANLVRAFRRWTGSSPSDYRENSTLP